MNISNFKIDHDFFSGKRSDEIAILSFKERPMDHIADLNSKNVLFDYLDLVSTSDKIQVLLIMGPSVKMGCEEYIDFYRRMIRYDLDRIPLERMYNAVNQFVLKMAGLNKMVIHAGSGKTILLFLNISLACDYRIVADNTVYQNPNLDLGLVPKGGSVFFLSKMLGSGKTSRILLSGKDISAVEAMKLGIVDKVVPLEKLSEAAIKIAQDYAKKPSSYVVGLKKLLNYNINELKRYLEYENEELRKVIQCAV